MSIVRSALATTAAALALSASLSGCANGPRDAQREPLTAEQSQELAKLVEGRVAQTPVSCLPPGMRSASNVRISENTLAYRQGAGDVYVNNLRTPCPGLDNNWDIIVTEQFQGRACSGDIIRLVDRTSGIFGGSCVLGDFTPYKRAG